MSLGENIKNAFQVVLKTYENVDKLIKYCDLIATDCGYESVTNKFLRYKSDSDYEGWLIDSFTKLYQHKEDEGLENNWKNGPIFVLEINFEDVPTVYLAKFEYEDMITWTEGVSPASYWRFTHPIDCQDNGFNENHVKDMDGYFTSIPTPDLKDKYWGLKSVMYTQRDLLQIDSNNIKEKIFGEFDVLRDSPHSHQPKR